jgi:hypothetical protein
MMILVMSETTRPYWISMKSLAPTLPPPSCEFIPRFPAVNTVVVQVPVETFRPAAPDSPTIPVPPRKGPRA